MCLRRAPSLPAGGCGCPGNGKVSGGPLIDARFPLGPEPAFPQGPGGQVHLSKQLIEELKSSSVATVLSLLCAGAGDSTAAFPVLQVWPAERAACPGAGRRAGSDTHVTELSPSSKNVRCQPRLHFLLPCLRPSRSAECSGFGGV
ncbi:hypothetical protein AAFF_G00361190 [Aldrovandia affinis]|uniref:Uncharacterized protein n=1 Tax=Aldrovandia affinis TaxID=143900 RepID=A0AAD7VZG0_9TELE|nr:hypothetical protein AAFF_G00361190 [Aldrovandia affinis]